MIQLRGLRRSFGDTEVLRGIDLTVTAGSYVAVVGQNGSGKSTLLRTMAGVLRPTEGAVVRSDDVRRVLLLSSGGALVPRLDAWQTAEFLGGVPRPRSSRKVSAAFQRFGVESFAARPVAELSLGMRQRLAFSIAAIVDPDVLLLDEPFHGLDPEGAARARRFLSELATGRTVVHATHDLGDVIGLADGLLLIEAGVARWVSGDLALRGTSTDVTVAPVDTALAVLTALGAEAEVLGHRRIRIAPGYAAHEIIDALVRAGCRVDASSPVYVT